uniref:Glutathione peroxidase n=1 Tax=Culicoides sonorensis TaxID=179676 RepID=A0A336M795_CULSO
MLFNFGHIPKTFGLFSTAVVALRLISSSSVVMAAEQQGDPKTAQTVYEFTANNIKGEPVSLEKYRGHVLIIVNVASKCGYTAGHYKELNELYDEFAESKGLRILAFPCNQFGGQEPGDSEQIQCFLKDNKVNFDLFEKIDVNGKNAHPLWQFLKNKQEHPLISMPKPTRRKTPPTFAIPSSAALPAAAVLSA